MTSFAGRPVRGFRFAVQAWNATSAKGWRDTARWVEEHGFSTLHLADHYAGPGPAMDAANHPAQQLAAVPAMAMAAEATETLRVGCRVFCVDYHLPAVLAKEAATLDLLSDGRLELGLGAGWIRSEYEAMGLTFDPAGTRITRLAEVVQLVKAHCRGALLEEAGTHVRVAGYEGLPSPVQRPHPPIMIGGGGPRILGLAGAEADIVSLNFDNRAAKIGAAGVQSATAAGAGQPIQGIPARGGPPLRPIQPETAGGFPGGT